MPTFAEQLSAVRKEHHITQEQLAQELNISRTTISRWESGKVLPDVETIKHLSQVLNYNFFSVEGLAENSPTVSEVAPVPEEAASASIPSVRKSSRMRWFAVGGLCLAVLCLFLLPILMRIPSAEIVVTPATTVAYLIEVEQPSGEKWVGWDVNFVFENRSGVPFTPEKVVATYYEGDRIAAGVVLKYEELRPWMSDDKLTKESVPLNWPFGSNQLYMTHMECVIYGTDDNGHELQARATVQYSQEYADAVEGQ
ncbi:MAG: helix-turn-helix domain-containing protein [Clostridia bacterium]|nr:helix-turn-helix domain-containing protein [Clostridia bacterium]